MSRRQNPNQPKVNWDARFIELLEKRKGKKTDRIFLSSKLEKMVLDDQLANDPEFLSVMEDQKANDPAFSSIFRDAFIAFYSLTLHRTPQELLMDEAKTVNLPIIDKLMQQDCYEEIRRTCEGLDLPAYEAAKEFFQQIDQSKQELREIAQAGQEYISVIVMLGEQLDELLEKNPAAGKVLLLIQCADAKNEQLENLLEKVRENYLKAQTRFQEIISRAADSACQKAKDASQIIQSWGDNTGDKKTAKMNRELVDRVKANQQLLEIARILGKYRQIIARKRKNSFAFGKGQKYDLTTGKNLNLTLSSEMALLASAATQPLFLRKYQNGGLKQYRKRDAVVKGTGDVIVCLDESISMRSILPWAKALSLAMLELVAPDKRNYALIHFSSGNKLLTQVFRPGQYTQEDLLHAAEHNFNGGTDFETPLTEALNLIHEDFQNAEILFITDGECEISNEFCTRLSQEKKALKFIITGILMDKESPAVGESLQPFCDTIYHSSDMTMDEIAGAVIDSRFP